ncbi:ribosomal RNA small subunit methyltransferase A [Candidatus Bipolaricaulota bacterium]|nr:ribosomal RNA small subunit methyltransferase A [Candidatus Bipolaricaulota bacterium]
MLRQAGIRPAKRLGQNFLVDRGVVESIALVLAEQSPGLVVEIGPGLGAVTEALVGLADRVVAVELDRRLAALLDRSLGEHKNLSIEIGDALRFDFAKAAEGCPVYVFGSLPYRSTAPILKYLIEQRASIRGALLITQREVAEKLAASPGRDGTALGVLVRAYADIGFVRNISCGSFEPSPEVESTLWTLRFLDEPRFSCDAEAFFATARTLYGMRRKMVRVALQQIVAKDTVDEVLARAGVPGDVRGETLGFEELDRLAAAVARAGGPMGEAR